MLRFLTTLTTTLIGLHIAMVMASAENYGKDVAVSNTYVICDQMEITAKFRDRPEIESTIKVPDPCAVAFSISATELVTSDHVLLEPRQMLFDFFEHQAEVYQRHNGFIFDDRIPLATMHVKFNRELISSEGIRLKTTTVEFEVPWNNTDPTRKQMLEFKGLLDKVEFVADDTDTTVDVVYTDKNLDLALLKLRGAINRERYIKVGDWDFERGLQVWGTGTNKPEKNTERPVIYLQEATILGKDVSDSLPPASQNSVWVYVLSTTKPNVNGVSGSPNVTSAADLVGVTHAITAIEHKLEGFMTPACDDGTAMTSSFTCRRYVIPGHLVYKFLQAAHSYELK